MIHTPAAHWETDVHARMYIFILDTKMTFAFIFIHFKFVRKLNWEANVIISLFTPTSVTSYLYFPRKGTRSCPIINAHFHVINKQWQLQLSFCFKPPDNSNLKGAQSRLNGLKRLARHCISLFIQITGCTRMPTSGPQWPRMTEGMWVIIHGHSWLLAGAPDISHSWSFEVIRDDSWSFVVIRSHSWSFVVIRSHS